MPGEREQVGVRRDACADGRTSKNPNQKQGIFYEISPKNKYIFKDENMHLIDDSEVINQKYIEIVSKGGNPYSKLSYINGDSNF